MRSSLSKPKRLFNIKESFRYQQGKNNRSESPWVEICIMNCNTRVFHIILLLIRIKFTSINATKGWKVCFFHSIPRLVFSRFLDLRRNLGNFKRKTCFSREKKRLAPRIYLAKFCLVVFLWCQRNLFYIFMRNRYQNGDDQI